MAARRWRLLLLNPTLEMSRISRSPGKAALPRPASRRLLISLCQYRSRRLGLLLFADFIPLSRPLKRNQPDGGLVLFRAHQLPCAGPVFSKYSTRCMRDTDLASFPAGVTLSTCSVFQAAWRGCAQLVSFPCSETFKRTNFNGAWRYCSNPTTFPAMSFPNAIGFADSWDGCSPTAASIENILVSLDAANNTNGTLGIVVATTKASRIGQLPPPLLTTAFLNFGLSVATHDHGLQNLHGPSAVHFL